MESPRTAPHGFRHGLWVGGNPVGAVCARKRCESRGRPVNAFSPGRIELRNLVWQTGSSQRDAFCSLAGSRQGVTPTRPPPEKQLWFVARIVTLPVPSVMGVLEPLVEIAKASGCSDLDAYRESVRTAVEAQRSVVQSTFDWRLVDET